MRFASISFDARANTFAVTIHCEEGEREATEGCGVRRARVRGRRCPRATRGAVAASGRGETAGRERRGGAPA